jgi:hypothetical protein
MVTRCFKITALRKFHNCAVTERLLEVGGTQHLNNGQLYDSAEY